jgi:hypothetical protein
MGKSQRLRLSEVRSAYRLVGECRELGADASEWRRHLLVGVNRLIDTRVGIGGQVPVLEWDSVREPWRLVDAGQVGRLDGVAILHVEEALRLQQRAPW